MVNIKKKIKEIVEYRVNEKCYLIYDNEGDFFVIYGTSYKVVKGGSLYDVIMSFVKENTGWKYTEKHIRHNKETDYKTWVYLDKDIVNEIIDIDTLYIDGKIQELD